MAYFDSPKNRAIWEVELGKLRKEKADFAAGKQRDTREKARTSRKAEASRRRPVTLQQLEKEEAMEAGRIRKENPDRRRERELSKSTQKAVSPLQKKSPVKER